MKIYRFGISALMILTEPDLKEYSCFFSVQEITLYGRKTCDKIMKIRQLLLYASTCSSAYHAFS